MATILIVEDDRAGMKLLVSLLSSQGHRTLQAGDGVEALALVRAERPDLVITDLLLPRMDGYEFLSCLRQEPELAGTRAIVYTASYHNPQAQELARAAGAEAILLKPCEPEEILRVVAEVLQRSPRLTPAPSPDFGRQHLKVMTEKLHEKVTELQVRNEELSELLARYQAQISERERTEKALRQSEDKFLRAFRSSPDSIAITSVADGRYIDVNDGFCLATGFTREEVIGHTAQELGVWVDRGDRARMIAELETQGKLRDFE